MKSPDSGRSRGRRGEAAGPHGEPRPARAARLRQYERLSRIAASLRRPVEAPRLWERIEDHLAAEKSSREARRVSRRTWTGATAAAVLAALLAGSFFSGGGAAPQPPLMEARESLALRKEQNGIEKELEALEPLFRREAAGGGGSVVFVREQIDFLDANIDNCRRLARLNALNRGVRRSLLNCFRKKIEIMRAFLARENGS